jgi:hypothetical protein
VMVIELIEFGVEPWVRSANSRGARDEKIGEVSRQLQF